MDGFLLPSIPDHSLHPNVKQENVDAKGLVAGWLSRLETCLSQSSFADFPELFVDDCWWRDIIGLEWDFSTKHGLEDVKRYVSNATNTPSDLHSIESGALKPILLDMGGMIWVQGGFTFKSTHGRGRGVVKLLNVGEFEWKAWTVFTQLERLNFQDELESQKTRNPAALSNQVPSNTGVTQSKSEEDDLQVLIVGAGQAGLSLGARLADMGIRTLLVDKHERPGDSWRVRYDTVTLNTPTYTDHYPFMKIPENWPRWLHRDQVASFMEHYAAIMGLDILSNASVTNIEFDEAAKRYNVQVCGPKGNLTLLPRHVVLATGVFSEQPIIPDIPGREDFKGEMYHSGKHKSARQVPELLNKSVVVIGPGTSGQDVAQDFVACGAKEVSIIQRNPIFYLSAESSEAIQLALWNTEGVTTEEADVIGNSIPLAVIRTMSIGMTKTMAARDQEMLDGLKEAGLALRTGDDGYGLADYQLIKGGHYYVDQGAGQMIVDGRIKIHRCEDGIRQFDERGLTLNNGTKLDADVVVMATGFQNCSVTVERLMGPEVVKRIGNFSTLDDENERVGWWRPTGQPGFWYMTGSFMWCRQYSQALALQIAAVEKGFNSTYYSM